MSDKPDIRGYINPSVPGETEAGQLVGMSPGAEIYTENRHGTAIDRLIKSVRRGSIVEVKELHCLAPADFRADKRRRVLADRIEAIKDAGGVIREWSTGHVSKGRLPRMMMTAYEQIATSGRARKREATGRPPREWSSHELEVMETVWQSRRYHNDNERSVAIREQLGKVPSKGWLRLRFGSPHKLKGETKVDGRPLMVRRRARARVYFLKDRNTVKIGYAYIPEQRMSMLSTGNPRKLTLLGTMAGGRKKEGELHRQFAAHRVPRTREWFKLVPEIASFIKANAEKLSDEL